MLTGFLEALNNFSVAVALKTGHKNATIEIKLPSDIWRQMQSEVRPMKSVEDLQSETARRVLKIYCASGILEISDSGEHPK